ncbi:MAG: sigma-70 family RNA polymerase sigma factor [Bacteroidetes bacterium]|nr:sigma-70 family RNA polymerase sigma factor [Bacteroidota bacterium]MCB0851437.1 sigma-70 family RNA polymerase sigma factor [Bacteroidota bacterium]
MTKRPSHIDSLAKDAQKGDHQAFREMYVQSYDKLIQYGRALDYDKNLIHDTIQDLFIWLIKHPEKIQGINNVHTYLFKCLRQNMHTYLKRRKKKEENAEKYHQSFSQEANAESKLIHAENLDLQSTWLVSQLNQLPPKQKEVIYLRFYEGLSYDEMADILSVSNQVVRNSVFRAIKKLRKNVNHDQNDPKNL